MYDSDTILFLFSGLVYHISFHGILLIVYCARSKIELFAKLHQMKNYLFSYLFF